MQCHLARRSPKLPSWFPRARFALRAVATYDFVVVGGGAAGAVVASRLSEDPKASVLLLEAGPHSLEPATAIPAACGTLQKSAVDWARRSKGHGIGKGLRDGMVNLPSGKILGGSTAINYMAYVRGSPKDYDLWAQRLGAEGWSWNEVLPYFKKSQGLVDDGAPQPFVQRQAHGTAGPWGISFRSPQLDDVSSFVAAAEEQGYTMGDYNSDLRSEVNGSGRGVVSPHQFSIKNGQRSCTRTAFIEPHMARSNLSVAVSSRARRILLEEQRAVGVEYVDEISGEFRTVKASQEVVLSSGSYATPGLLLRSGIGPKRELEEANVQCHIDIPAVGKNLKDHLYLCVPVSGLGHNMKQLASECGEDGPGFQRYLETGKGLASTSLYEASAFFSSGLHPDSSRQDGQISFGVGTTPVLWSENFGIKDFTKDDWRLDAMFSNDVPSSILIATLNQPTSRGEVILDGEDVEVRHNYLDQEADLKMFVAICKEAAKILDQPSLRREVKEVLIPQALTRRFGDDLQNDHLWEAWIRSYAQTIYHPVSSCAINQVVDPKCQVFGLQGLRVADGSVMPEAVSGNTQAPCVMIGEKVADMIALEYGLTLQS